MTDPSLSPAALRGAVDLSSLVRAAQSPAAGPGSHAAGRTGAGPGAGHGASAHSAPAATLPPGLVHDVDDASFGSIVELSRTVPVIVEFYAAGIEPALGPIIASYGGRLALATVDGNRSPQAARAFQVQQVPAVAGLVGAQPLQLFVGMPAENEVRAVLDQVLELAAQHGVTGVLDVAAQAEPEQGEPAEPPLPPLHQAAFDAISAGDYATAAESYRTAIAQNPRDTDAVAGLAQVSLLLRLDGADASAIRSAAASAPDDVDAQLAVADLDVSGGHVDDAFARLLRVFLAASPDDRASIRARLLDYFEIVGADDPRTVAARRALTNLLY